MLRPTCCHRAHGINLCVQTNTEALGAVRPVREPAPGESGGSGPAGQAAALRPPAEADGS